MLCDAVTLWVTRDLQEGVVPEDTHGLGPLLCLQEAEPHSDGRLQGEGQGQALAVQSGAHDGRVDDRPVRYPGGEHIKVSASGNTGRKTSE